MAKTVINLNQFTRYAIHRPSSDSKRQIYYTPIDSSKATTPEEKLLFNDKELVKDLERNLGSPTNIRRLWITCNCIGIETYVGTIVDKKNTELFKTKCWSLNCTNNAGKRIADFEKDLEEAHMLKQRTRACAKGLNRIALEYIAQQLNRSSLDSNNMIKFEGGIVGHINSIWSFNNIEEIYFDWSVLLDENVRTKAAIGLDIREDELLQAMYSWVKKLIEREKFNFSLSDAQMPLNIVFNNGEIPKTFKRLRTVAFIPNLSLFETSFKTCNTFNDAASNFNMPDKRKTWLEVMSQIGEFTQQAIIVRWSRNVDILNKETFTTKENYYLFDKLFLKPRIDAMFKEIEQKQADNTTEKYRKTEDTKNIEDEINKILELETQGKSKLIPPILTIAKLITDNNATVENPGGEPKGTWSRVLMDKQAINARLLDRINKYTK